MARLGDICTVSSSNAPISDNRIWLLNLDMVEQQTGNIISYNYVGNDDLNGSIIQFDTDNVLYSKLRPNLNKVVIPDRGGFATSEMLPLKPNASVLCREYLAAYLRSDSFVSWAVSKTAGAKMPRLGTKVLLDKEIPLPSLEEQRRIAALLDKVSDLIAKRRAQLDKLDLLVKARFVEMFEHVSDQVLLSDVAEVTGGLTKNSKRKDFPIKLPYLRVANVFFDTIDTNEILEIGLTEEEKRKTLLQNGDLLFVEGNGNPEQIGRVAVWQDEIVPCVHQNHLIKARFNLAKMLPTYAMNYFMTQKGREQIREKAVSTSGLYTLSVSKIESLHIPFAPMDRQLQFTDFKEKVDKSKLTIRQSLNKLETLKKALMQQYFG